MDYTTPPMANEAGKPAIIKVNGDEGLAEIKLQPLYSRLELHQITSLNRVRYTVAGVYVDSYYSRFTMTGDGSGEVWNQEQDTDFTAASENGNVGESNIGDVATGDEWKSMENNNVATPSGDNVWAYHMAAGAADITVSGYKSDSDEWNGKFEPGRIYKVTNINFDENDLGPTPNPKEIQLVVKIEVLKWVPVVLNPEI